MTVNENKYKTIIAKLNNLARKDFASNVIAGLNLSLTILLILFLVFSTAENGFYFNTGTRTFFILLFAVTALLLLSLNVFVLIYKNIKTPKEERVINSARMAGNHFPIIKDDLINAVQLVSSETSGVFYSTSLINAAFENIHSKTDGIEFSDAADTKKIKHTSLIFFSLLLISVFLFTLIPSLSAAGMRLLQFRTEFIPPDSFGFNVSPGNFDLLKGNDLNVLISVKGKVPDEVYVALKFEDQTDYTLIKTNKTDQTGFSVKLTGIRANALYYAVSGDIKSETFSINVMDYPVISSLSFKVMPPSYSGAKSFEQKDNGNITALTGTRVEVNLSSTNPLAEAVINFSDTTVVKLKTIEASASGSFTIRKDLSYKIQLKDKNGNYSQYPVEYSLKTLYDEAPSISMLYPNENTSLGNDNRQNITAGISDDYGFSSLKIFYKITESTFRKLDDNYSTVVISINNSLREQEVNYIWNLTSIGLGEKEVLTYYLEVGDNDIVNGPKTARTASFIIRVPSLNEILTKADEIQNNTQNDMKQLLKEADELKKNLENIDKELKQDKKDLSWKEKEKIENAVEQFKSLTEKLQKAGDEMKQMQNELQENNLLSKETMQKYMELQKLMEEFSSEDFKKAMEKMQNALNQMNRQMTQEEMKKMKVDEEKFRASLERTLELMKRIQVEQKMDEMIKRADDLIKQQEELQKQASKNNNSEQNKQLADKQKEITDKLKQLDKEMEDLKKKMKDIKDMPNDEMEKLSEEFDKDKNEELSEDAEQDLMQQDKNNAQQKMSQISKNMQKSKKGMQSMQQSMQQQNQMQTYSDLMKLTNDILSLSKKQEELKKETNKSEMSNETANKLAEKQNSLSTSLDNIAKQMGDLSKKTFAITPEMGKSLGDAKRQMQNSTSQLQNRNSGTSQLNQSDAMKSLNEAASMMKGSMESMMQGGGQGQGGMMSLMQQLGKFSQQQMNLNNMTQQMQQMQGGKLTPQQQAEMQRMGMQQELLKKSMEQLNREAQLSGQSKKLPGNLENISKQMEEIVAEMQTDRITDDLIQKQEKILSKMLEVQKSINERDFENQRESYTGQNFKRNSPNELNQSKDNMQNKIRDELNKSVREGYKKDYESVIKNYFEKLSK